MMPPDVQTPVELLGTVSAPSGKLLVIDPGLMNLWSHDRPVRAEPSRLIDDQILEIANSALDLRIVGPDATDAGRLFQRQWHHEFLYDIPSKSVEQMLEDFHVFSLAKRLRAELVALPERVRHRRRIDNTLNQCPRGGVVQYHGIPAIAVANIPSDRQVQIFGQRMQGKFEGRWRHVSVELAQGTPFRSELLGRVGVDEARLLLTDIDALGRWDNNGLIDGLADYVFWGRDAKTVAQRTGAPMLGEGEWGWIDIPVERLLTLAEETESIHAQQEMKFATDFRPHTIYYFLLRQMRASVTQSGIVSVGGSIMCGLFTTWGDGHFDVYVDYSKQGVPLRVRIDLGGDRIVEQFSKMLNR